MLRNERENCWESYWSQNLQALSPCPFGRTKVNTSQMQRSVKPERRRVCWTEFPDARVISPDTREECHETKTCNLLFSVSVLLLTSQSNCLPPSLSLPIHLHVFLCERIHKWVCFRLFYHFHWLLYRSNYFSFPSFYSCVLNMPYHYISPSSHNVKFKQKHLLQTRSYTVNSKNSAILKRKYQSTDVATTIINTMQNMKLFCYAMKIQPLENINPVGCSPLAPPASPLRECNNTVPLKVNIK